MSDDLERLRALESLFRSTPNPAPYLTQYLAQSAGVLTPEALARALDELCNPPVPLPSGGYARTRLPWGMRELSEAFPPPVPDPEWTVEAGGYRLLIREGAMVGLEYTEPD